MSLFIKEVREKEGLTPTEQEHPKSSLCFQWDSLRVPTELWELSPMPMQDSLSDSYQ